MFNTETGTWECGRLTYYFKDSEGAQGIPGGGWETQHPSIYEDGRSHARICLGVQGRKTG